MKDKIKILIKDRFLFYSSALTLLFLSTSIILIAVSYTSLPPLVPILNSMPWGMKRLYSSDIVLLLPLITIGVVILNTSIAIYVYRKFTLLGRIISFNSFLFCLLVTLAYLQILFLIY